jgi:rRNA-processing protein FCF1
MQVNLRPGRNGRETVEVLSLVRNALVNARGGATHQDQQMMAYVGWATTQAQYLQSFIARDDIERLVLTRSFYALLDNSTGSSPRGFPLLSGEVTARLADLEATIATLDGQLARWESAFELVVLDTNVYVHAPDPFDALDLSAYLGTDRWHLLIPLVVIDELDRLKRSTGTADNGDRMRNRARQALRSLEQSVEAGDLIYPQGYSTVEVVLDPDRHVRMPLADDEIIDRAVTVQRIAGRSVHVMTSDTGMLFRARAAGLSAHKLETVSRASSVRD